MAADRAFTLTSKINVIFSVTCGRAAALFLFRREAVSYPMPAAGVDEITLREILEAVGLPGLAGRLDESSHWTLQLSPGEQQRIAFARALVQKPDWLFLDEATSAVDEATEALLYRLVRERLPRTTLFSVGQRATLSAPPRPATIRAARRRRACFHSGSDRGPSYSSGLMDKSNPATCSGPNFRNICDGARSRLLRDCQYLDVAVIRDRVQQGFRGSGVGS